MKKNKYISNIMVVTILLISSMGMYLLYPSIKNSVIENTSYDELIDNYASNEISYYNYAIDFQLNNLKPSHIKTYTQVVGNPEYNSADDLIYRIENASDKLNNQKSFEYYAINTKTNKTTTNSKNDLSQLFQDSSLKTQYQWSIKIHFDDKGLMSIERYNSHYSHSSENLTFFDDYSYEAENGSMTISNPTNLTITYAVHHTIPTNSDLENYILQSSSYQYFQYSFAYIFMISVFICLIVILIPYKYLKDVQWLKTIASIKFEFLSIIWCTLLIFLTKLSPALIGETTTSQLKGLLTTFGIYHLKDMIIPVLNIIFWLVFFLLIMVFAYMIKYLFHKGLKRYILENTVLGWIIRSCKKLINYLTQFDMADNINKVVLKIVLINFAIISVISIFFMFGIFFAIIYSILLYIILQKRLTEIKKDYQVLLKAAKRLSNGHFDEPIHEDVGLFNPLKEEFSHIQEGFEKAVKEEVKSQKMKTELISNVSHDLKTPLTSIITYVDLLKNDQLSNEEKNNYIQILERNSLRLKNLIDDLFEVSKVNSGDIQLDLVDVDIVALIKQAQYECIDKLEEQQLDMRTSFDKEKMICLLDSSKTYRIFENLFINMSKYALPHTRAYIEVKDLEDSIKIIFKNISAEEMSFNENDIVERFVQGDKSRNTHGSGLGLAIVKSFTEIQNGKLSIDIDGDLFKSTIEFKKAKKEGNN